MMNLRKLLPYLRSAKGLLCACLILLGWTAPLSGQDLSAIGQARPVKVSGSLNASGIGYAARGIEARRDPFTWFLAGSVNVDLYGWSVPFSFSYSDQDKAFRQPFNRYGISPYYKWVKAYLGYHNLSFSRYTLAGHLFSGAAVELTPKKWKVTALYGQFNKAVAEDTLNSEPVTPAFRRMGYGLKAGYNDGKNTLEANFFRAKDETGSLPYIPVKTQVLPAGNLVGSLSVRKQLGGRFSLSGEYARSAYTRDLRADTLQSDSRPRVQRLGGLFTANASTQYFQAYNAALTYQAGFCSVQLQYEKVDPEYKTLGAYYFNNNLENITLAPAFQLLENKLSAAFNAGLQRNNLGGSDATTTKRIVSSVNLTYVPNPHWNLSGMYSNFSTYTNVRPLDDPFFRNTLDTLNFYQLTQNAGLNGGYSFGSKERKQGLYLNTSFQTAREAAPAGVGGASQFYNGNLAYRYSIVPADAGFTASLSANHNQSPGVRSLTLGPNLSVNKSFLEKSLRTSAAASVSQVTTNGVASNRVLSLRLDGSYAYKKSNNLGLNLMYLQRFASSTNATAFQEYTGTVNYTYSF